jgi:hypothetical protein
LLTLLAAVDMINGFDPMLAFAVFKIENFGQRPVEMIGKIGYFFI